MSATHMHIDLNTSLHPTFATSVGYPSKGALEPDIHKYVYKNKYDDTRPPKINLEVFSKNFQHHFSLRTMECPKYLDLMWQSTPD